MSRIVVDPITRIEGHLRIEATVDNGKITDAYSAGTRVRGIEKIPELAVSRRCRVGIGGRKGSWSLCLGRDCRIHKKIAPVGWEVPYTET